MSERDTVALGQAEVDELIEEVRAAGFDWAPELVGVITGGMENHREALLAYAERRRFTDDEYMQLIQLAAEFIVNGRQDHEASE